MACRKQTGAKWLHRVNNKTPHARVWGEKERELKRLAEKWEDDGVPFDEIVERIRDLRMEGGAL